MLENNRALVNRLDEENLLVPSARVAPAAGERPNPSILTIIWRRRWVFFGCILLAVAAAVVYLAKSTPIYSSSSQILARCRRNGNDGEHSRAGAGIEGYPCFRIPIVRALLITWKQ